MHYIHYIHYIHYMHYMHYGVKKINILYSVKYKQRTKV